MKDIKKTVSSLKKYLSEDGAREHFLFEPGPPPHIEFARTKFSPNSEGAQIGMATRDGNTVYLVPKVARLFKAQTVKDLNKVLRTKLDGVVFELGDAPASVASASASQDAPAATTSTADPAPSSSGRPDVAVVMQRIAQKAGNLLSRNDLPSNLMAVQAALNKAAQTQQGDPGQLASAYQKLRSAVMAFDAEREGGQTASTSDYGNIPRGQDPDMSNLPPLPPTPDATLGAMPNPGPLPPTPQAGDANYGDLLLGDGASATGYDDTYQDLTLVQQPDGTAAAPPAAPATVATSSNTAQTSQYGAVTEEDMEAYRQESAKALAEIEDEFNDKIKAAMDKLEGKLDGTEYAPDTRNFARVQQGILRFQEIAEGLDPDQAHLRYILRELRKELIAMITAIKAKSAT